MAFRWARNLFNGDVRDFHLDEWDRPVYGASPGYDHPYAAERYMHSGWGPADNTADKLSRRGLVAENASGVSRTLGSPGELDARSYDAEISSRTEDDFPRTLASGNTSDEMKQLSNSSLLSGSKSAISWEYGTPPPVDLRGVDGKPPANVGGLYGLLGRVFGRNTAVVPDENLFANHRSGGVDVGAVGGLGSAARHISSESVSSGSRDGGRHVGGRAMDAPRYRPRDHRLSGQEGMYQQAPQEMVRVAGGKSELWSDTERRRNATSNERAWNPGLGSLVRRDPADADGCRTTI